jgi:hypothetical protein
MYHQTMTPREAMHRANTGIRVMVVKASCPSCGVGFKVKDHLVGKEVRCLKCQKPFTVGQASAAVAPAGKKTSPEKTAKPSKQRVSTQNGSRTHTPAPAPEDAAQEPTNFEDFREIGRIARERPPRASRGGVGALLASLVLLVLLGVGGWYTYKQFTPAKDAGEKQQANAAKGKDNQPDDNSKAKPQDDKKKDYVFRVPLAVDPSSVVRILFSGPQAHQALVCSKNEKGHRFDRHDLATGGKLNTCRIPGEGPVIAPKDVLALSPDGGRFAYVDRKNNDSIIHVCATEDGKEAAQWMPFPPAKGPTGNPLAAHLHFLDANSLVLGTDQGVYELWDVASKQKRAGKPALAVANVLLSSGRGLCAARDQQKLAVFTGTTFQILNAQTGDPTALSPAPALAKTPWLVLGSSFSADGARLGAWGTFTDEKRNQSQQLIVWDVKENKLVREVAMKSEGRNPGEFLWWGPKHMVTVGQPAGEGFVYNIETGQLVRRLGFENKAGEAYGRGVINPLGRDDLLWYVSAEGKDGDGFLIAVEPPIDLLQTPAVQPQDALLLSPEGLKVEKH